MCFLKLEVILYCTFAVKAGVKKSGKPHHGQPMRCGMVLGGVWGCTVSWMVLGDRVLPDFFTPAFTANVL